MIDIFILMIHIVITYWITLKYSLIVNNRNLCMLFLNVE